MRDFFHGWRRKVGCALSLVAIGLCTLSARSQLVEDTVSISTSTRSHLLTSLYGRLIWEASKRTSENLSLWNSQYADYDWLSPWAREGLFPTREFAGFEYGGRDPEVARTEGHYGWVIIPYSWPIIPTTLLSAYLILVRPRVI
ncbi:MAG: hypothetical protein JWP89_974 [Schlesneria sp.]|nr:hypothetical protein [Schlesneria sp.]